MPQSPEPSPPPLSYATREPNNPILRRRRRGHWSRIVGTITTLVSAALIIALVAAAWQKHRLRIEIETVGVTPASVYFGDSRTLTYEAFLLGAAALNALANLLLALALIFAASPGGARRWLPIHRLYARGQLLLTSVAVVLWIVLQLMTRTPMSVSLFSLILAACGVSVIYPIALIRTLPINGIHFQQTR